MNRKGRTRGCRKHHWGRWFWVGDHVMVRFCLNRPCISYGRGSKVGMQAKKGVRLVAEDWE